jgi:hypothetical protein
LRIYYEKVNDINSSDVTKRNNAYSITFTHQSQFLQTRASKIIEAIEIAKKRELDYLLLDRTHFEDLIFTAQNLQGNQTY